MSTLAIDRLARAIVLACEASGAPNVFAVKELCVNFGGPTPGAAATILLNRRGDLNQAIEPFGWSVSAYNRPRYQYGERTPATFNVVPV